MHADYSAIYRAIAAIPRGRVAGYGHIATRVGLPGRARLVAQALAHNEDSNLPWHRVVRSSGHIAIPRGSRGFREQVRRLRAEGVDVRNGRVPMRAFGLDSDLDRALWGMPDAP